MNEAMLRENGLNASAKSIDSGQPARTAQADPCRNFLHLVKFLQVKGPYYFMISSVITQSGFKVTYIIIKSVLFFSLNNPSDAQ